MKKVNALLERGGGNEESKDLKAAVERLKKVKKEADENVDRTTREFNALRSEHANLSEKHKKQRIEADRLKNLQADTERSHDVKINGVRRDYEARMKEAQEKTEDWLRQLRQLEKELKIAKENRVSSNGEATAYAERVIREEMLGKAREKEKTST